MKSGFSLYFTLLDRNCKAENTYFAEKPPIQTVTDSG